MNVLELSHGSEEALDEVRSHYASGEWEFIGLQVEDQVVGCAGAERLDGETIGIRSIAVDPSSRHRGFGRALVRSLAERLGARRVVAETDDDAVGFYRSCGFAVERAKPKFGRPRYWCVLDLQDR